MGTWLHHLGYFSNFCVISRIFFFFSLIIFQIYRSQNLAKQTSSSSTTSTVTPAPGVLKRPPPIGNSIQKFFFEKIIKKSTIYYLKPYLISLCFFRKIEKHNSRKILMCNEKMASMVLIMADDLPSEKILMNFFEKHSMPLFRNKRFELNLMP